MCLLKERMAYQSTMFKWREREGERESAPGKIPDVWMKWPSERTPCRGWRNVLPGVKRLKSSLLSRGVGDCAPETRTIQRLFISLTKGTAPLHTPGEALSGYYLPCKPGVLNQPFNAPVAPSLFFPPPNPTRFLWNELFYYENTLGLERRWENNAGFWSTPHPVPSLD